MTMHRFYIPPTEFGETIRLAPDQARHLAKVLRLKSGDEINVFDGCGREYVFRVEEFRKADVYIKFVRDTEPTAPESNLKITLAVPILKKSNTELVLHKAVELGVSRFVPILCARSEASVERWKPERAQRISYEAAKQCGRATIPAIDEPIEFAEFVESYEGEGMLFYEEKDGTGLPDSLNSKSILLITGPEGGWEDEEIELAKSAGIRIVHFGGRILKAETAAIIATALVQHRFGDLT